MTQEERLNAYWDLIHKQLINSDFTDWLAECWRSPLSSKFGALCGFVNATRADLLPSSCPQQQFVEFGSRGEESKNELPDQLIDQNRSEAIDGLITEKEQQRWVMIRSSCRMLVWKWTAVWPLTCDQFGSRCSCVLGHVVLRLTLTLVCLLKIDFWAWTVPLWDQQRTVNASHL